MKAVVMYGMSNGDRMILDEGRWEDEYMEEGFFLEDDTSVIGFLESAAQSDFHPLATYFAWKPGANLSFVVVMKKEDN